MAKKEIQYVTSDIVLENGLTLAEERFCMAYIDGGDAKEAYHNVYGRSASKNELSALCDAPNVIKRISNLYNQRVAVMQHACMVDVDLLVRELEQARQIALQEREASAAIAATMGKAKLHGLLIDKREISLKRPEDMTEAELRSVLGIEFEEDLRAGNGRAIEQSKEEASPEPNAEEGVYPFIDISPGENT
jgi:phage terminase small subunit